MTTGIATPTLSTAAAAARDGLRRAQMTAGDQWIERCVHRPWMGGWGR